VKSATARKAAKMLLIGSVGRLFIPPNDGQRLKLLNKKPDPILDRAFLAF
jgi:hypothetical protein